MNIFLAIVLVAIGVLALLAYSGTPHVGPTSTCGPITFFNQTTIIGADCRAVSFVELVIALFCFMLAVFLALGARPRRSPMD